MGVLGRRSQQPRAQHWSENSDLDHTTVPDRQSQRVEETDAVVVGQGVYRVRSICWGVDVRWLEQGCGGGRGGRGVIVAQRTIGFERVCGGERALWSETHVGTPTHNP